MNPVRYVVFLIGVAAGCVTVAAGGAARAAPCVADLTAVASFADSALRLPPAPSIGIEADATSTPTFGFEATSFDLVITNTGSESLTDVAVVAEFDGGALDFRPPIVGAVTGPIAMSQNGDDVLDVGEFWAYTAVAPAANLWFVVSAETADGTPVAAEQNLSVLGANFWRGSTSPIAATLDGPDAVTYGELIRWTFTLTNLIDTDLVVGGQYRLWDSGRFTDLGQPDDSGDSDDFLSGGESWSWTIEYEAALADGVYLQVSYWLTLPDLVTYEGQRFGGLSVESDAVVITPTPTTQPVTSAVTLPPPTTAPTVTSPDVALPATGTDLTTLTAALALLSAGSATVVLVRRRSDPPNDARRS